MPHPIAILIAGAGAYAGFKWLRFMRLARKRENLRCSKDARRPSTPKDMGVLEYDDDARIYRPKA